MKKKETGKESLFFVYFITLFLFGKTSDITSISATLFLIFGVYTLYYKENTWKYLVSGIFFSFALFSKPHNTPLVAAPTILFYFITSYLLWRKEEKVTITEILLFLKEQRKNIMLLFAPIFILFLSAILFLNHFLIYNYIIHTYNPVVQTYTSMIKELVTFTYWYNGLFLLLYLGIIVSGLRLVFYKKFDLFSFVACISFPVLILLVGNKFGLYKLIDQYRYILPLAPFYCMNIFCFVEEFKRDYNKKALYCILGMIFTFLFIVYITLGGLTVRDIFQNHGINDQKFLDRIKYDVERPLTMLPETEGKILVERDYFHRYDLLFNENPYEHVSESNFTDYYEQQENSINDTDMAVAGNFITIGLLDSLEPYIHNVTINRKILAKDLRAGEYSTIILGPYVNNYANFLKTTSLPPIYCRISAPFIIEGDPKQTNQFIFIYFEDNSLCTSFIETMQEYYTTEFNTLCARGELYIQIINDSMEYNGVPLEQTCSNKSQLYLLNNSIKIESLFFCILLIGYISYGVGIAVKNHRSKNPTNNKTAGDTQSEETQEKDSV
ncbi:hypothetical protein HZC31_07420 [Candidatus Woesearchaeota archaeon]|nr:hypothetical protein [Candidatus Woesearchaeota archaeon]